MVRAEPNRFAVAPYHVADDVEAVVKKHSRFWLVEKLGEAGEVAESSHTRIEASGSHQHSNTAIRIDSVDFVRGSLAFVSGVPCIRGAAHGGSRAQRGDWRAGEGHQGSPSRAEQVVTAPPDLASPALGLERRVP